MSVLLDLADALADCLDAVNWSATADGVFVERRNWPRVDVDELGNPHVSVVPGGIEATRLGRRSQQHDCQIFLYVGRRTPTDALADEMLDLAEEIVTTIEKHDWATIAPAVTWPTGATSPQSVQIEINPGEALQERNVWRAAITVTYRMPRSY